MTIMDMIRIRLAAVAMEACLWLMPKAQETNQARRMICSAAESLIDALEEED